MKVNLMALAVLVASLVVAMPTDDELEKANKEVQAALETQITARREGRISAGDLAALMLRRSRRFKDEAQRYVCLQMAFEAAVHIADVILAADILEEVAAGTKDFGRAEKNKFLKGALKKADHKKLNSVRFIPTFELESEKRVYMKSVSISDATAYTVVRMKHIWLPTFNVKPPTTLAEVVAFLNMASRKHDLHTPRQGVKIVLNMAKVEPVPAVPEIQIKNITVYDAVKVVAKLTGCDFEVKDDRVVIFRKKDTAKKNQQETKQ